MTSHTTICFIQFLFYSLWAGFYCCLYINSRCFCRRILRNLPLLSNVSTEHMSSPTKLLSLVGSSVSNHSFPSASSKTDFIQGSCLRLSIAVQLKDRCSSLFGPLLHAGHIITGWLSLFPRSAFPSLNLEIIDDSSL